MKNSITYFLDLNFSNATNSYGILFDFSSQSTGRAIYSLTGYTGITGQLVGSTGGFYSNSGVASFNNNSIKIKNITNDQIDFLNCTYMTVFERTGIGAFTLFNCVETGVYNNILYYKGYEFGVTANNKLFFEYYSNTGPQLLVGNQYLSDAASVFLNVGPNNVSFGDYDFYKNKANVNSFSFNGAYVFDPSGIYIGYNPDYTGLYNTNLPFKGKLDNFIVFSPSVDYWDISLVNSGVVSDYYPSVQVTEYDQYIDITGYETGTFPYFTGVTGQQYVLTGTVLDDFGNLYSGYTFTDLTGVLYTTGIVPVTGMVYIPKTGYSQDSGNFRSDYLIRFNKKKINLLSNIDSSEVVDIVYSTGGYNIYNNLDVTSSYGYLNNDFTDISLRDKSLIYKCWVNGLRQCSGSYAELGDIYSKYKVIQNDFILNDNRLKFANTFNSTDDVIIDYMLSGSSMDDYIINNFNLSGNYLIPSGGKYVLNWPSNLELFFNGQKILSGKDSEIGSTAYYGITGDKIYFKNIAYFSGTSGTLIGSSCGNYTDKTGCAGSFFLTSGFVSNFTKVYRNGIRLKKDVDYLELPNNVSGLGTGIFDINDYLIYNGTEGFV